MATSVVRQATWETRPVRRIARKAPVRSEPIAAAISTAARVGMSTWPTTPENATRISASQTPAAIAQRPRAPAATLIAVWLTEPPTGWPRKRPESTLPTPWARSRGYASSAAVGVQRRLAHPGALDQHERRHGQRAGDEVEGQVEGQVGGRAGTAWAGRSGIGPDVVDGLDRGGVEREGEHGRDDQAISEDHADRRVRASPKRITSASSPAASDGGSIRPGCVTRSQAFREGERPAHVRAGQVAQLTQHDVGGDPVRKPIITECGTKRV